MRLALAILLASTTAAAETSYGTVGLGSSYAADQPGWMLRTELRQDFDDDRTVRTGARLGLEFWKSAEHVGFDVPLGVYWCADVGGARTSLGFGAGLWNIEYHGDRAFHGIAPFASGSIELARDKLLLSLDVRVARSIVSDASDFNVYSLMLMVGKRRD